LGLTILVRLLAILVVQAATVAAISDLHLGRTSGIGAAYAGMRDTWFDLILIMIIAIALPFVGAVILVASAFLRIMLAVPAIAILLLASGIWIALAWSLAIPVAVIEKQGPLDSIPRSSQLTKGSRGAIFVILLLVGTIAFIFYFVLILVPTIALFIYIGLQGQKTAPSGIDALALIAGFLSSTLVMPLSTIALSLVYYNQRVRKEGFDLQVMMSSLKSLPQIPPDVPMVP